MRRLLITILIAFSFGLSNAKTVADLALEFSMVAPDAAKVEVAENEQGRSVNVVYQSATTDDTFTVSAVRANNGGFDGPLATFFERMMNGTSKTIGKQPTVPQRRLTHKGLEFFVAQHQGVGPSASQTLTTVVFLQDRGSWRKVVTLQLLTRGMRAPTNDFIVERMNALQFRPAA
jgi:hypothetical protein